MSNSRKGIGVFILSLLLALTLQDENRAYEMDFAGHPDEAAHVVTGLMVRDYLAGGFLEEPMPLSYAHTYAKAYPKVALGHYPPFFYCLEGLWLWPLPTKGAVLIFAAMVMAGCAVLIFTAGQRMLPDPAALGAALGFVALPLSQKYTATVMSDGLQVLMTFAAILAFARFVDRKDARSALGFGFLAALAILTKAAGLLLALVPGLWMLLSGKWTLLKRRTLWLAPLPVLVLAMPWMLFTLGITQEGARDTTVTQHAQEALPYYLQGLRRVFGVFVILLAIIGGVMALRRRQGMALGCVVLGLAGGVFFLFVPAGLEDRYLLVTAPPMMLLGAFAIHGIWERTWGWVRYAALAFCLLGVFLSLDGFRAADKRGDGFSKAVLSLLNWETRPIRILASSDARGEGALVAAAALASEHRPHGEVIVARGSKRLADVEWLGQNFALKATDPDGVRALLDGIDYLIVDHGIPSTRRRPDHDLVEHTVATYPNVFEQVASVPSTRAKGREGILNVYRIHPMADEPEA